MYFTVLLCTFGVLLFVIFRKWKHSQHNYPPGLPSWPIVGSILELSKYPLLHFGIQEWSKTYGPVFGCQIGMGSALFITGADNVLAALRKEEFQGRPLIKAVQRQRGDSSRKPIGIFFGEGPQWANSRKFTMRQFRNFTSKRMEQFVSTEVDAMNDYIKDGSVIQASGMFSITTVNAIWLIIANRTFQPEDERIKVFIEDSKIFFRSGTQAGSLADAIPCLQMFDKAYQNRMHVTNKIISVIKGLIAEHKTHLDPNYPCDFIDNYLLEIENSKTKEEDSGLYSEQELEQTIFDLFLAGTGPLISATDFILLYMVLYPDVQAKMQKEIDDVLGKDRTPTMEDKNRLNYTSAVLNEVARINPTAPIAVPHRCVKDTHFNNYFVEKDAMIMMDFWNLLHDPKYWEKPGDFMPERFLDENGEMKKNQAFHPFGLGQRMCAGDLFSKNILFLIVTTFFQKYSLSVPEGEPKPSTVALPGITSGPRPFRALITSRY